MEDPAVDLAADLLVHHEEEVDRGHEVVVVLLAEVVYL